MTTTTTTTSQARTAGCIQLASWQAAVRSFRRMSEQPVAHAIAATVITVAALWNHPNHSRGLAHLLPAVPNCDSTVFANPFGEHTARLRGVDLLQALILEEEDRHALVTPSPNATVLLGRCQDAGATVTLPPSMPLDMAIAGGIEATRAMRRRHEALHHRLATGLQDRERRATRNWHRCRVRMTERLKLAHDALVATQRLKLEAAAAREEWAAERVTLERKAQEAAMEAAVRSETDAKRHAELAETKRKVQAELVGAQRNQTKCRNKMLADHETVIAERDAAIAERDKVISERDQLRIAADRAEATLAASAPAAAKTDVTFATPKEQTTIPPPLPPLPPRLAEECPPLGWLLMASTGTVLCAVALITGRRMRMLVLAEAKARAECLQLEASSVQKEQDVWGELAIRCKAAEQRSSLRQRAIDDAASQQPGEPLTEVSFLSLGNASTTGALQVEPLALTLTPTLPQPYTCT